MTRRALITALVGVPALLAAAGMTAVEVYRLRRPAASLFTTPFVYSLAEAIDVGDLQRAYAFIRDGQDPNAPIVARDEEGRQMILSPLAWARAKQRKDIEMMLLAFGARP